MDDKFDELLKTIIETGKADTSGSSTSTTRSVNESYDPNPTKTVLNAIVKKDENED